MLDDRGLPIDTKVTIAQSKFEPPHVATDEDRKERHMEYDTARSLRHTILADVPALTGGHVLLHGLLEPGWRVVVRVGKARWELRDASEWNNIKAEVTKAANDG